MKSRLARKMPRREDRSRMPNAGDPKNKSLRRSALSGIGRSRSGKVPNATGNKANRIDPSGTKLAQGGPSLSRSQQALRRNKVSGVTFRGPPGRCPANGIGPIRKANRNNNPGARRHPNDPDDPSNRGRVARLSVRSPAGLIALSGVSANGTRGAKHSPASLQLTAVRHRGCSKGTGTISFLPMAIEQAPRFRQTAGGLTGQTAKDRRGSK